jgi:hypothetical protein
MSAFTDLKQYHALQLTNNGYWFDTNLGILNGPRTTWAPLPENDTQPIIIPRSTILHTNAGKVAATWQQLWKFLFTNSPKECHFDVDNTGAIGQFMSVTRRADCNFSANSWFHQGKLHGAVSIETGDNGAATVETTPWNFDQLDSIVSICTALAIQYDTGCGEVLAWDGAGIDYHTKFPYVGPGIPAWTNARGKTCPGTARKRQVPFVRTIVTQRIGAYINKCKELGVPHGIKGV